MDTEKYKEYEIYDVVEIPEEYRNMTEEELDEEIARLEKEDMERKQREAEAKNK